MIAMNSRAYSVLTFGWDELFLRAGITRITSRRGKKASNEVHGQNDSNVLLRTEGSRRSGRAPRNIIDSCRDIAAASCTEKGGGNPATQEPDFFADGQSPRFPT